MSTRRQIVQDISKELKKWCLENPGVEVAETWWNVAKETFNLRDSQRHEFYTLVLMVKKGKTTAVSGPPNKKRKLNDSNTEEETLRLITASLKDDLHQMTIKLYCAVKENEMLKMDIAKWEMSMNQMKIELKDEEHENEMLRLEIARLENDLDQTNNQLKGVEEKNEMLTSENVHLGRKINLLEEDLDEMLQKEKIKFDDMAQANNILEKKVG